MASRDLSGVLSGDVQGQSCVSLQVADDAEQVAGLRVAGRAEHADQAFR